MKRFLQLFALQLLFWMGLFKLGRIIFIVYHGSNPFDRRVLPVFFHALRLDFSTACYLTAVPLVLMLIHLLSNLPTRWGLKAYYLIMVPVLSLIMIADAELFRVWGSKVNAQAIGYLRYPSEALTSSLSSPLFLLLSLAAILTFIACYVIFKLLSLCPLEKIGNSYLNMLKKSMVSIGCVVVLLVGMRGGIQLTPVNQSSAYFSNESFLNNASVNAVWNLFDSLTKEKKVNKYRFRFVTDEKALQIHQDLYDYNPSGSLPVLTSVRPNIVLVIMESFTADLVASLGGEEGITPGFDQLSKEGLLFTNIYASGDRTDKGLASILTGFPALPSSSILKAPTKFEKINGLPDKLKKEGYSTAFYYGGESEFFNFKAFALHTGLEKIIDKGSFSSSETKSRWGAHDHILYEKVLKDHRQIREPFFTTVLTLSNHEPFDLPTQPHFKGNDRKTQFKNTSYYADESLLHFIGQAKTQPWYKNTLFIIVADHGSSLIKDYTTAAAPGKYHIPMLWYGEVLKDSVKGRTVDQVASQNDLPATLLKQLNVPRGDFKFSNDIFTARRHFAFFTFDNGMGWVDNEKAFSLDVFNGSVGYGKPEKISRGAKDTLKACLQHLIQVYSQL